MYSSKNHRYEGPDNFQSPPLPKEDDLYHEILFPTLTKLIKLRPEEADGLKTSGEWVTRFVEFIQTHRVLRAENHRPQEGQLFPVGVRDKIPARRGHVQGGPQLEWRNGCHSRAGKHKGPCAPHENTELAVLAYFADDGGCSVRQVGNMMHCYLFLL